MKAIVKKIITGYLALSAFSRQVLELGMLLSAFCYLLAGLSLLLLPYSPSALTTLGIYQAGIQTAPGCFVAAVCAALICDVVIQKQLQKK